MVEHMSLFNAAKQSLPFAQAIKHILHFQDVSVSHLLWPMVSIKLLANESSKTQGKENLVISSIICFKAWQINN